MLSKIPDKRLEGSLVKSLTHPVERRTQVVDEFLARRRASHVACQFAGLGDIRVTGLHPQEVGVGCEFPRAFGGSREACAVVVESFTGSGAVAGPDDGGLGVVVGQGPTAGDGQVRVLFDLLLVCVPDRLGGTFGFEVCINSYKGQHGRIFRSM